MIRYYSVPKETFVTNGTIVEPLNVTENGTYAPPAGTAYSPVVVNVEGGGSSDFSTAEVTVVNNTSYDGVLGYGATVFEENGYYEGMPALTQAELYIEPNSTMTYTMALYKGNAILSLRNTASSISGNITQIDGSLYMVTGDCTITIS